MKVGHVSLAVSVVLLFAVAAAGPYQHLPGRRGTFAMPTGTILAGEIRDVTATVTGAQTDADCYARGTEDMDDGLVIQSVVVTAADTVRVRFRNVAILSLSSPAGTGSVRCFNP